MSFGEDIVALVQSSSSPLLKKAPHWERVSLGSIAYILNGYPWDAGFFGSEGVPLVRIRDVTSGRTNTRYNGPVVGGFEIANGDLLVGMDGDFNICRWKSGAALLNQRVCRIDVKEDFYDTDFLELVLPPYLKLINYHTSSVTVKHLSSKTIANIPVPLPSLPEQRRLSTKLCKLTARAAYAQAQIGQASSSIDRLRMTTLRQAVTGILTETWRKQNAGIETVGEMLKRVAPPTQGRGGREATDKVLPGRGGLSVNNPGSVLPPGWQWVSLLRLAKQETGHTPSRSQPSYWGGGIPWVGIRDAGAHHGRRIDETAQTISDEGLANSSARLLPADTVCLSRTASVGYVTILGRPMATSQDFATWTCGEALLPGYLMLALLAEGEDIRRFGMGSTHTTIYFPEIRALHVALPPMAEQHEIIVRVESALARADNLEVAAARAAKLVNRLEASILTKAFRGELVPQDPTNEPATALLDRIRAGHASAPKQKRGRGLTATGR